MFLVFCLFSVSFSFLILLCFSFGGGVLGLKPSFLLCFHVFFPYTKTKSCCQTLMPSIAEIESGLKARQRALPSCRSGLYICLYDIYIYIYKHTYTISLSLSPCIYIYIHTYKHIHIGISLCEEFTRPARD